MFNKKNNKREKEKRREKIPEATYIPPASIKIPEDKNIGIRKVIARECVGSNISILVRNINISVEENEELIGISNYVNINGFWTCIILVRELQK